MKHEIFISYSDFDRDKVALIVEELEGNLQFAPIVIASNREALKPLAQKVADGIIRAQIIVPILTSNSINTQWINQEIGFATALGKKIMPIAENSLIDQLKGFIHKQIDLPYNYLPNNNKGQEHKAFIKQVRNLIADLEREFQSLTISEILPEKTEFEKSLEKADKMNEELEFQRQRNSFINSDDGIEAANTETLNMFADIEAKILKLKEKGFHFGMEKTVYQPTFILKCEGFSFSIAWQQQYTNSNEGALLYVRKWRGHLSKDPSTFYLPNEKPKILLDVTYSFDRNKINELCWLNQIDKKQYFSQYIVDNCLSWLVEQVAKKRLTKK